MDAVSGDSDGNDCGGGGCVREVSWGVLSECECVELDLAYWACAGMACGAHGAGQYGHWVEYGEPFGDCGDYAIDRAEYDGREDGGRGAECVYFCEGAGAGGGGFGWFG